MAKRLEQAGAVAIGVHCREVHERPVDNAHWEALAPVVSSLSVPVLANGDIFVREDIEKVRKISGANSFLIARGALTNASIFREQGALPYTDVSLALPTKRRLPSCMAPLVNTGGWLYDVGRRGLLEGCR